MAQSAPGPAPGAGDVPTADSHSTSSYTSATAPSNADPPGSLTSAQSKTQAQLRQPVRRSSSIQEILETGRRRSEILSASNSNSNSHTNIHGLNQHQANSPQPLRRSSTIKITPEQAEHLREHEEFLEWKRQKSQREAQRQREEGMDSADERSAIRSQGDGSEYGTNRNDSQPRSGDLRSRPSQRSQQSNKTVETARDDNTRGNANQTGQIHPHTPPQRDGFWKRAFKQFGSLELENKASVARDHLALGMYSTAQLPRPDFMQMIKEPNLNIFSRTYLPGLAPHFPSIRLNRHRRNTTFPLKHHLGSGRPRQPRWES